MQFFPVTCNNCDHEFDLACIENPPRVFLCTGCSKTMVLDGRDNEKQISYYRIHRRNWDADNT